MNHRTRNTRSGGAVTASVAVCARLAIAGPPRPPSHRHDALRDAVTVGRRHGAPRRAFQAIADANGGNRAAGTPGHEASRTTSRSCSRRRLRHRRPGVHLRAHGLHRHVARAVARPRRTYTTASTTSRWTSPAPATSPPRSPRSTSTSAVTAHRRAAARTADFAGFPAGNIALIQRGSVHFSVKADNALGPGASGVIIFNQGNVVPGDDRLGLFGGTLDDRARDIPVVSAPFALGAEWATTPGLR